LHILEYLPNSKTTQCIGPLTILAKARKVLTYLQYYQTIK